MPKVKVRAKRAASKQALNKLQHILGIDQDRNMVEISSEDEIVEVDMQPPKKKYKLTNKSTDGGERRVVVLKSVINSDDTFFDMDCSVEDLSPIQKSLKMKHDMESKQVENKLQQLLRLTNCEVYFKGVYTTGMEITEMIQTVIASSQAPTLQPKRIKPLPQPTQSQAQQSATATTSNILLQPQATTAVGATAATAAQSYQLVMDPRSGLIVGAVPQNTIQTTAVPAAVQQPQQTRAQVYQTTKVPISQLTKSTSTSSKQLMTPTQMKAKKSQQQMVTPTSQKIVQSKTIVPKPVPGKPPLTVKSTLQQITLPGTQTLSEKILQGKPIALKPLQPKSAMPTLQVKPFSAIKAKPNEVQTTETTTSAIAPKPVTNLQGKTFPSLVVVARPHLRVKDLTADRPKLDAKVKSVLMYPPAKFTEWLIQQGLLRSDQTCALHPNKTLKLGMFSDSTKFPYSGGYVWISDCCPLNFVSVFSGSLFEGTQHPPVSILKLIYHWCCQTVVQNVTQWVKVDNLYVKGMYTLLRAVCTVALHTHIKLLGGPGMKVEIGVISLGTTSQDGHQRQVKVEVLGILESTTKLVRLRAVEPLADGERNYKKRFVKILEPIMQWVHPSSIIVTDLTVDKTALYHMGFANVVQSNTSDYANSNRTIMEYLRRIVPRMFQNTLSLLSRQIIQQFLDELVWREWYGSTVLQCFDNMVLHLSEQTRSKNHQSLLIMLNKVSANPFKSWAIDVGQSKNEPKRYTRVRKVAPAPTPQPAPPAPVEPPRPQKSSSPDVPEQMVPLESYYYGTVDLPRVTQSDIVLNIKCSLCKLTFANNIMLMTHLFKHAHNVTEDVHVCRYCLTILPTCNELIKHISKSHASDTKFDNQFICLICEARFNNPFMLGKHMSKEHSPYEMPYTCDNCNFRCSNHKMVVDHFYSQHCNRGSMQCPFCLKSVSISLSKRNMALNMTYFVQHLQKHQKKTIAKKCPRCILWFVQKDCLKEHQNKMHHSQRGVMGLNPFNAPRNGIMVPKSKLDRRPGDNKNVNLSTISYAINKAYMCKECNKTMAAAKHFTSYEHCKNNNCHYATCCKNAMGAHNNNCKNINASVPVEELPFEMYCICGYSNINGNLMAKHLTACEKKTAYPSMEGAKEATVTHSMLDVLGLVRKSEDNSSLVQNSTDDVNVVDEDVVVKKERDTDDENTKNNEDENVESKDNEKSDSETKNMIDDQIPENTEIKEDDN